ncbi:MAG: P-type ATPase [Vagococcus sp.]
MIVTNTSIGIYQEIKAKKQIDTLSILNESQVTVVRDYKTMTIPQNEVVKDELIVIRRGQQIVVDGIVIETEGIEYDESQLTGESDLIIKLERDRVFSGSFVVSGQALMKARQVGTQSYSYKFAMEGKPKKQKQFTVNCLPSLIAYPLFYGVKK